MAALVTAFGTAIGTIKTDALSFIASGLPIALEIVGAFIAIKFGLKFFKSVAK